MRANTQHFLVGLFVIGGALLITLGIVALGSSGVLRETIEMETLMTESVQGLDVGSPLKFRGVRIGEISDIKLANRVYDTEQPFILVRVAVRPEAFREPHDLESITGQLREMIDRGLRVRLASQGVTGTAYLEADYLTDDQREQFPPAALTFEPSLPYVPSIPSTVTRVSTSLEAVLASLRDADIVGVVASAKATLDALREQIDGADLPGMRGDVRRVSDTVTESLQSLRDDVRTLLARANAILERSERAFVRLDEELGNLRLGPLLEDYRLLASDARGALNELRGVLRESASALDGVDALLARQARNLHETLANVRRISDHLATLTGTLERYPSLLLLGEPPPRRGQ